MAANRGRNNRSTERRLRAGLVSAGISGWRINATDLVGKPDFVFDEQKVAIFVDGCFWHGCECKRLPKTNIEFWTKKIETNVARDKKVSQELRQQGWKVIRIREHEFKRSLSDTIAKIRNIIAGEDHFD